MVTNEKCPLQFFPVKEECASERVRKNLSVRNADKSLLTCYTCMLQLLYIFVDKIYLKVTFIICNSFSKECPRANNFKSAKTNTPHLQFVILEHIVTSYITF